jgi:hypothetical protein
MRVRATPEEFGAGVARATGRLAEQAGDVAFGIQQQRQREIAIEQERQRRIAEKEADVQRRIDEGEFKVQYTEAITLAAEEAALQPEDQQEAFFDNAVANIRNKIPTRFDDPVQQQLLDLDVESYAVSKRVGVRRTANQARIEKGMSVFAQRETQLINQSIFGKNPTERVTAENDLRRLYESNEAVEYFTPFDLERRTNASQQKISYEREILRINGIEDPDQAVAYIESLDKKPPPGLDPTDIDRLKAKAKSEVGRKTEVVKALRSDLKEDISSADTIISNGDIVNQSTLDEMAKRVITLQDEDISRRYNDMVESNEDLKVLHGSTGPVILELVQEARAMPTAGLSIDEQKRRSDFIKNAETYLGSMDSAFQKGQVLDFLGKTGSISVQPFDLNDISSSIDRRLDELRATKPYVVYDERLGPAYEANFFTQNEAQSVVSYINRATPEEKGMLALTFQKASSQAPQIWEQISEKNGQLFAMAGAIGDIDTASLIFQGDAMLRQKTVSNPSQRDYLTVFSDYVGDTYRRPGTAGEDEAIVINAALAHYAATRTDPTEFSEDEFVASIDAVTGGIGEYNDYRLELPRGLDQDVFEDIVDEFSPEMLRLFAPDGVTGYTDEQAVSRLKNSRLVNSGMGGYYVVDPGSGMVQLFAKNSMGVESPVEIMISEELLDYLPSRYRVAPPTRKGVPIL